MIKKSVQIIQGCYYSLISYYYSLQLQSNSLQLQSTLSKHSNDVINTYYRSNIRVFSDKNKNDNSSDSDYFKEIYLTNMLTNIVINSSLYQYTVYMIQLCRGSDILLHCYS